MNLLAFLKAQARGQWDFFLVFMFANRFMHGLARRAEFRDLTVHAFHENFFILCICLSTLQLLDLLKAFLLKVRIEADFRMMGLGPKI
jgi:hypothetical protein